MACADAIAMQKVNNFFILVKYWFLKRHEAVRPQKAVQWLRSKILQTIHSQIYNEKIVK